MRIDESPPPRVHSPFSKFFTPTRMLPAVIRRAPAARYATGVGSREAPPDIRNLMSRIAHRIVARGFRWRSGAADGADRAIEAGAGDEIDVYLPWAGFNGSSSSLHTLPSMARAEQIAAGVHPRWDVLKRPARLLHTRNVWQVLGDELDQPSEFVLCWTADGAQTEQERTSKTGGTGTAIVLAARHNIPVINLARADAMERLAELVLRNPA
jgi:hypothetical protein